MKIKRKIAVLGANLPLLNFYKRAKKLNYEIHSFAWEEGAVCKEFADFFYPISIKDTDGITKVCVSENLEMVTSFSLESALPYVNRIAQTLGQYCPDESTMKICANKLTMRKEFHRKGISIPFFVDGDEVKAWDLTYPVIVKPIDSGGSRGVTMVEKSSELAHAIERARSFSTLQKVLIEQYINGPEFSVEAISHKGDHYIVVITEKVTTGSPSFVELAHFQPAFLSAESREKIEVLVKNALSALHHIEGPSHTEVRFDEGGNCFIIEVGLRLGGDFIASDLVRLSTGYDMVESSIELACGNFIEPRIEHQLFSGVYFKSFETMKLWNNIDQFRSKKYFIESEEWLGDQKQLTESSDRRGYFIYQYHERLRLNGSF